jgi:ERCC4-type nuclease
MNIKVFVANNEQKPWTEEEIGYPTFPMETKAGSGIRQVGDYYATCDDRVVPILVERKSLQDAYGSFIVEKNRARLYAEIMRFQDDPRFDEFVIIVEATESQFMAYYPWAAVSWHKNRGSLPRFFGATKKKKATVIQHLKDRGAEIIFADNRQGAASVFSTLVAARISKEDL